MTVPLEDFVVKADWLAGAPLPNLISKPIVVVLSVKSVDAAVAAPGFVLFEPIIAVLFIAI
jgi:hypothetical protein